MADGRPRIQGLRSRLHPHSPAAPTLTIRMIPVNLPGLSVTIQPLDLPRRQADGPTIRTSDITVVYANTMQVRVVLCCISGSNPCPSTVYTSQIPESQ